MRTLIVRDRDETRPDRLRRAGIVPIGLIEKGRETRKVQAPAAELEDALGHAVGAGMLNVQVEGEGRAKTFMVASIQRELTTRRFITVTLKEVAQDDVVTAEVPVIGVGTPAAVADGSGVLSHQANTIKLKGAASALPGQVEIELSSLGLNMNITAGDLRFPNGLELASPPDAVLFSVHPPRAVSLTPEAPIGEPEVVGETTEEQQESAATD
jgi:large subunit ribosomal protein L25